MIAYLIETATRHNDVCTTFDRELLECDAERAELPQCLERIDAIVRETTSAMDTAGETPEAEWIVWDRLLDAIECDRDNAAGLDSAGVRYTLPDGRVIEATRMELDADTLDAMTNGFITAGLWSDCQPHAPYNVAGDDEHGYGVEGPDGLMPDERHATAIAALDRVDALNEECDDYTGETGGLEYLTPSRELRMWGRVCCARFMVAAGAGDIDAHMDAFGDPDGGHPGEYVGNTFYLDAARHGVSFTDRAWGDDNDMVPVCERLRDVAKTFPDVEHTGIYACADGETATL